MILIGLIHTIRIPVHTRADMWLHLYVYGALLHCICQTANNL